MDTSFTRQEALGAVCDKALAQGKRFEVWRHREKPQVYTLRNGVTPSGEFYHYATAEPEAQSYPLCVVLTFEAEHLPD